LGRSGTVTPLYACGAFDQISSMESPLRPKILMGERKDCDIKVSTHGLEQFVYYTNESLEASTSDDEVKLLLWLAFELDTLQCDALNLISFEIDVVPTQSWIVVVRDDTPLTPRGVFRSELFPHIWLIG
jgi:hypothetical protein